MQVLGLGVFWVALHCSGMCGPIMAGVIADTQGQIKTKWWLASRRILGYQAGRALTYMTLGAIVGTLGAAVESSIHHITQASGIVVGVALVFAGLSRIPAIAKRLETHIPQGSWAGSFLGRAMRLSNRIKSPIVRTSMLGVAMGFLPCMLMFWVLGVAASTASTLHGAGVMLMLIVMTTPVLLVTGLAPALLGRRWRKTGEKLIPGAITLSGIWMLAIAFAANGWIEHIFWSFKLDGRDYFFMLY